MQPVVQKLLAGALGAQTLTLAQCVVASACGALIPSRCAFSASSLDGECAFAPVSITTRAQLVDTAATAAAFLGGFITLNSCVRAMHVSLVMVLRALEPLTTLALGAALFGANVPLRKAAALLPVVAGCACSAVGPFSATAAGLALAALSNVCFSLRGLLGKRLSREHGAGALESFFHLCVLGALFQAAILAVGGGAAAFAPVASAVSADAALVALNGASFYAYLQLSWVPRPHERRVALGRQLAPPPRHRRRRARRRARRALAAEPGGNRPRVRRWAGLRVAVAFRLVRTRSAAHNTPGLKRPTAPTPRGWRRPRPKRRFLRPPPRGPSSSGMRRPGCGEPSRSSGRVQQQR